ncbi:MAG: CocE/NonD family hydrolase [candidate division WOR-3 bacterium]|nr:MAG: CocE/NonD family hydrolase [candidate division WOR-3 bacterium]
MMPYLRKPSSIFLAVLLCSSMMSGQKPKRVGYSASKFGRYVGYSQPLYSEWVRTSRYLEMSDGVKLAVDIIRPAKGGKAATKPMPAVWNYYRYHRAREQDGNILSMVDRSPPLQTLVKHGYVIVVVDARGTGASYGSNDRGPNSIDQARDLYEITEWIVTQPWSDGNVGMFGHSYSGYMQFRAAAQAPPHLKAIFPSMATFDLYEIIYRGGVFGDKLAQGASRSLSHWDIETAAPPVDEDSGGVMLAEARAEHQRNVDPYIFLKTYTYRDTRVNDLAFWIDNNPRTYAKEVNESGIPVYQWAGWYDFNIRDMFQWSANLSNPQKLTIGPWSHASYDWDDLLAVEQLRWFDYWLKGIDNGIMDEPSINYAAIESGDVSKWYSTDHWPLPNAENVSYFFTTGPSGSIKSVNDGVLSTQEPTSDTGHDTYTVDYSASSDEDDMSVNDAKGLTFTSMPLEDDVTIIGHPVVTLYITSTTNDVDCYAYLEEIDDNGTSTHITNGILRASHRLLMQPSFNNLGIPYHRHFASDAKPLEKNKVVELKFDLLPIARVFKKGSRMRLTLTGADQSYSEQGQLVPPPTVKVYRSQRFASHIDLPIVKI